MLSALRLPLHYSGLTIDVGVEETKLESQSAVRFSIAVGAMKLTMNWKFDFSPVTRDMMALVSS
jgi:hypothetical protein